MVIPPLGNDQAYGRFPDGTPVLEELAVATPLGPNQQGGFGLRLSGNCPGVVSLHVGGATPGGAVAFVAAAGLGSFSIPNGFPCAGTLLDLDPLSALVVGQMSANANGIATLSGDTPDTYHGSIHVQALDVSSCSTSTTVGL